LAAEYGKLQCLEALLDNENCNSKLEDSNGHTPIHSVISSIERAADRHDNRKVEGLMKVLEVFMEKRPSDFQAKLKFGKTKVTGLDRGRACRVEKVQQLFKGFKMILGTIKNHEEFNPQDFNTLLEKNLPEEQQQQLKMAIFSLLEKWAFDPESAIEKNRSYLKKCIYNLHMFDSLEHFDRMRESAKLSMDKIHQKMYEIRNFMGNTSEDGKNITDNDKTPSISSDGPQMNIKVKSECVRLGRE